ncbi:uncharacterized protein LOC132284996 [Cornus florida]|uniref:uncharacterized protein LOC132284996 n=1 Tax=Cornus florida TaxID=4283 RepID=UPI00289D46B6|nr:uncharacterized protein LOC132284996 [Cornus florida]
MDASIAMFCKTLAGFCNHLQSSCDALKQSIERRPIPLDSASSTYVQRLNNRVSSTSGDLNLLESMSFGTVSFEELLGHCNEVYKKTESDLVELEDRLRSFGYVPEIDKVENDEVCDDSSIPLELDLKTVHEDPLFEDSLSLQDLGLSDVCLATIASEAKKMIDSPDMCLREPTKSGALKPTISISENDYEDLPSYMKSLASWEDLLAAVEKMNSSLREQVKTEGGNFFLQSELALLGLGPKARSYLLLLVRLNRLVVETIDGSISYRVL